MGRHSFRATIYVASVYDVKKEMQPSDRLKFSLHACNDNFALSTSDRLNKYRQINACNVFVEGCITITRATLCSSETPNSCVCVRMASRCYMSLFCQFLCLAVFARN